MTARSAKSVMTPDRIQHESVTIESSGARLDPFSPYVVSRKRGGQKGEEAFSFRCFRMFMRGKNTLQIAKHLMCSEAKVAFHLNAANEASYQRSLTLPKFKQNARQDAEASPASARRAAESDKALLSSAAPHFKKEA